MARRAITLEFYTALVAAYREMPGNHFRAAKQAGCDRATAKRGWERGWPYEWAPAIKEALKEEAVYLRAARQQAQEEADKLVAVRLAELEADAVRKLEEATAVIESAAQTKAEAEAYMARRMEEAERKAKARYNELLEKAKTDAIETMAEEVTMTKLGRKAAQGAVFIAASFFQNAKVLSEKLVKAFGEADMTPQQALAAASMLTRLTREANEAVRTSLENERLRLGEPTEVVGIVQAGDDKTVQEMEIELAAVAEAIERMKVRGEEGQSTSATEGTPNGSSGTGNVH